ncbi:hypothetical protein ACFS07_07425 [Undibacterium arcticum]
MSFVCLEDGFLRSLGTGEHFPPLSLVVDGQGVYYDSTRPSALESLLASPVDLLDGIAADVARAKALVLGRRLSKYNHAPLLDASVLRSGDVQRVLVIDQTVGDMSVTLGGAGAETFAAMLAAARAEKPAGHYLRQDASGGDFWSQGRLPDRCAGRFGGRCAHRGAAPGDQPAEFDRADEPGLCGNFHHGL